MFSPEQELLAAADAAFFALYNHHLPEGTALQATRKDFEGHYTLVTFPLGKLSKNNPVQTGEEVGAKLKEKAAHLVADFNVVKGFLNLVLQDEVWLKALHAMTKADQRAQLPATGQKVVIEYSSPNTNKPLHLGHLRNNFLGYATAQILAACGHQVVKTNLVNDRGIHICKSMVAYRHFGQGETPETSGLKGDHLVGKYYVEFDKRYKAQVEQLVAAGTAKEEAEKNAPLLAEARQMLQEWEEGQPEVVALWETMNGWVYDGFAATYQRMGVSFDKIYKESETYLLGKTSVEEGLAKGVFFRKDDGSVWADLTKDGLDQKLLLRSDGTSVYMTQDIGTAQLKYHDYQYDQSVYVVGNEQDYHFQVLFLLLAKLGSEYAKGCFHLSYGMVDLPSGKMKSREGTVVDADELMEEMAQTAAKATAELGKVDGINDQEAAELYDLLGVGALKYYLLKVDPKKRMMFNPEESIQLQGHTGPFIQYTHARIAAIGRKLAGAPPQPPTSVALQPAERDLVHLLTKLEPTVQEAGQTYAPSVVANYAYDVAKAYNRFYTECSILNEEDTDKRSFRISLSLETARVLRGAMGLLGISVPDRM